jgi:hypothetical protein
VGNYAYFWTLLKNIMYYNKFYFFEYRMDKAKYKGHQLIEIPFPATGNSSFYVDSLIPVDKIRITVFDNLFMTNLTPGIVVWSDLVNNVIGTVATEYAYEDGGYYFTKPMAPHNGMTYFYKNKMILNGEYSVQFRNYAGDVPSNIQNNVYILVEYFVFD